MWQWSVEQKEGAAETKSSNFRKMLFVKHLFFFLVGVLEEFAFIIRPLLYFDFSYGYCCILSCSAASVQMYNGNRLFLTTKKQTTSVDNSCLQFTATNVVTTTPHTFPEL